MPSLQASAEHRVTGKPLAPSPGTRASSSLSEGKQDNATKAMTNKIDLPLLLQVIASISIPVILAMLALVALINPQFAEQRALTIENRDNIAALDTKLSGEISALESKLSGEIARLDNRITVEVARLDNKFDALANLMIVALSNGPATEAELVAVWESIRAAE